MANLPVIVGFGGINPAGRSSGNHAYRRMVLDQLALDSANQTLASLASLTGQLSCENGIWLDASKQAVDLNKYLLQQADTLKKNTLIRQLERNLFDPAQLLFHKRANLAASGEKPFEFSLKRKQLPDQLPPGWTITSNSSDPTDRVGISASDSFDVLLKCYREAPVNSAGQLPSGFDPSSLYASRNHPRGLQLTVYSASDAINSLGIDWEVIKQTVSPDKISVYNGSGMSQLDYNGYGGMLQARLLGKKVTSKQLPLGYAEMPADFINAYILGNLGTTGTNVAACATFLYNLRQGIRDIQTGTHRVVIVGTSEAPLVPEIFEGFTAMGALADDDTLRKLDSVPAGESPDYRRACRPFGYNAGFTLAESAQCVVLFDDGLALELGATIYGAVNEVFINADGFKKSIASPGLGNYISVAKAVSATQNIIGEEGLQKRTYVQAHGTGTLQNRLTESHILNDIAQTFNIQSWPVAAIKSYVGHSLASSAGDQLVTSLGVWHHGIIPGIPTVDEIADDVHTDNLDFLLQHKEVGAQGMDAVLLNSKGFGGNNATASVLAPHIVEKMLAKRHGSKRLAEYWKRNEAIQEKASTYDQETIAGRNTIIYKFDNNVLDAEAVDLNQQQLKIHGISPAVNLAVTNSYSDCIPETK